MNFNFFKMIKEMEKMIMILLKNKGRENDMILLKNKGLLFTLNHYLQISNRNRILIKTNKDHQLTLLASKRLIKFGKLDLKLSLDFNINL
jgi:hypothetical protein